MHTYEDDDDENECRRLQKVKKFNKFRDEKRKKIG